MDFFKEFQKFAQSCLNSPKFNRDENIWGNSAKIRKKRGKSCSCVNKLKVKVTHFLKIVMILPKKNTKIYLPITAIDEILLMCATSALEVLVVTSLELNQFG